MTNTKFILVFKLIHVMNLCYEYKFRADRFAKLVCELTKNLDISTNRDFLTNVKFTPQKREKVLSRLELYNAKMFRVFQLHNAKNLCFKIIHTKIKIYN